MVSLFVFRKLLKGWPLNSPGKQISWCPGHLFCIPAVSFFLGHGSQRVVLVFVLPFGSKCFAVLIQGGNNQALLVLSVNEGLKVSFAFTFVAVNVINAAAIPATSVFFVNVFFIIVRVCV